MDITLWIESYSLITLMPFSGFFSSSETSLFSRSKMLLEQMRCDDALNQTLIKHLPSQSRRLIVTILMIMNSSKSPHPWFLRPWLSRYTGPRTGWCIYSLWRISC